MKSLPLGAVILMTAVLVSCSAKRDAFLKARDYPYAELPATAVRQTPAYPVPPKTAAEDELVFVNRPRPLPEYLGQPPAPYEETKVKNLPQFTQLYSVGYNTRNEASLFITPRLGSIAALVAGLSELGLSRLDPTDSPDSPSGQTESYAAGGGGDNSLRVTLYKYHDSLMLSVALPADKRRSKKEAHNAEQDFKLLDDLRELLLRNSS